METGFRLATATRGKLNLPPLVVDGKELCFSQTGGVVTFLSKASFACVPLAGPGS